MEKENSGKCSISFFHGRSMGWGMGRECTSKAHGIFSANFQHVVNFSIFIMTDEALAPGMLPQWQEDSGGSRGGQGGLGEGKGAWVGRGTSQGYMAFFGNLSTFAIF